MIFLSSSYWCVKLKRAESVIWIKKIKIKLPISLKLQELSYFLSKTKKLYLLDKNIVKLKLSQCWKNIFNNLNLYFQSLQTKYRYSAGSQHTRSCPWQGHEGESLTGKADQVFRDSEKLPLVLTLKMISVFLMPASTDYSIISVTQAEGLTLLLLLSHFSRVRLCATPSLGFSRQEHWSGLPFPSSMHESENWKWSCSVMSDSLRPHGLQPTRLLCPWDFPGKSIGVGCHCLLRPSPISFQIRSDLEL